MRVHHLHWGSGPPIVATAGIGKDGASWEPLARELPDFTFHAWDLPGHGQSPVPDDAAEYTRDRVVGDLDDMFLHAASTETGAATAPVVLGHSLGGYLTMAWAATRGRTPTAMVLLATGPGFRDAEKREAWNARSRRNAHRFGVPPQAAEMNLQEDGVVIENVPTMDIPTLLLCGSEDRPEILGGCSYLEAKLPRAEFVTVDGGDHLMHESADHAPAIAEAIRSFVNGL